MNKVMLRINELLEDRGKSAYWLARQLGMGDGNLYKYRKSQVKAINLELIARLCELLECSPGDLFEIATEPAGPKRKARPKPKG